MEIDTGDDEEVIVRPWGLWGFTAGELGWEGVNPPNGLVRLSDDRNEGLRFAFWPGKAIFVRWNYITK